MIGNEGTKSSFSPALTDTWVERRRREIPGPGTYDGKYDASLRASPSYKIGSETRDAKGYKNLNPDGGAYNPNASYTKASAPNYRMGKGERQDCYDKKKAATEPGPGNYELKSAAFNDKAKFHYGSRLNDLKKQDVPAPGTYDSKYQIGVKAAPSY